MTTEEWSEKWDVACLKKEEDMSQGLWEVRRSQRKQENEFSSGAWEGTQSCRHPGFSPEKPMPAS